jgi:hypothetical protein
VYGRSLQTPGVGVQVADLHGLKAWVLVVVSVLFVVHM